jgi:hypothetical protein
MLKKAFAILGAAFCLQAPQSEIRILKKEGWEEIRRIISEKLPSLEDPIVIFDCDEIMCTLSNDIATLTSPVLHEVLRELTKNGTPFFCMTSYSAAEWTGRHKDFECIEVTPFFHGVPTVFSKPWDWRNDDDLPYYVDGNWNIVYTFHPKGLAYTVQDPFDYYDALMHGFDEEKYQRYLEGRSAALSSIMPKGDVLCSLIDRGFLRKPGSVIFVDDSFGSIASMGKACKFLGIPYLGICCEAYRPRKK